VLCSAISVMVFKGGRLKEMVMFVAFRIRGCYRAGG